MVTMNNVNAISFGTPSYLGVPNLASSLATGDFNSDGLSDVVVSSYNRYYPETGKISVLLANGTGSFDTAIDLTVGNRPNAMAVGDFNLDNNLDLAVTDSISNQVSVLLGTGTGSFDTAIDFAVGDSPSSVAVGDFNSDGQPDLAVTNYYSNSVSVLLGIGTGSFDTATNFAVGDGSLGIAVGDFNSDSFQDLVVSNTLSDNISVLLGTGTGSFASATNYTAGIRPGFLTVADFNSDGNLDLAVPNRGSADVSVLLGTETGAFDTATNFAIETPAAQPNSITAGDFDNDGKLDLAIAHIGSDDLPFANTSMLLGTGTGSFNSGVELTVGVEPFYIASGDFNGDEKLDLVTANRKSLPSVSLNTTNRNPVATEDYVFSARNTTMSIAVDTLLANDTDADGDFLKVTEVMNATNGTASLNDNGTPDNTSDDLIVFTPQLNFRGKAYFEYTVSDELGGVDTGLVTLKVGANFNRFQQRNLFPLEVDVMGSNNSQSIVPGFDANSLSTERVL
jgi:hypothetical protein